MLSRLVLNPSQWQDMLDHVDGQAPLEACGLLAGRGERVEKVIRVRNEAQSAVRFVMDPYEQLQALGWIESQALELVGIFHSHPAGPETPSATDIAEAAYEAVSVIWSRSNGTWQARAFWLTDGQSIELPLLINDKE